jgi:hypothetical protein
MALRGQLLQPRRSDFDDGKLCGDEEGVDQDQGNAGEHGYSVEHVHLMAGSSGWQAVAVCQAVCWARAFSWQSIFQAQGHAMIWRVLVSLAIQIHALCGGCHPAPEHCRHTPAFDTPFPDANRPQ